MPEGDTVWRAARNLNRAFAGASVIASDFRVPELAVAKLDGATITEVIAVGKHILMRLSDYRTLHSHLRMDGDWQLFRSPARAPSPAHEIRVVIETTDWTAFGLRVHDLALIPTPDEARLVGHLGPDLLHADFDLAEALRRIRLDPRTIAEALLEQRNLAGIGNLYKSEVLFLHGINPARAAASVDNLEPLVRTARRLLLANREHPEQSSTGSLRRGETHWVYLRAGKACRRCGSKVRTEKQGEPTLQRVSFWCPTCQPE